MKTFLKKLLFTILIITSFSGVQALAQSAQPLTTEGGQEITSQTDIFRESGGFNREATVGGIAAKIINIALGLLAIIFIVLLIQGGYTWMMAQGNEDQVKKAMGIIKMAVIGLVIVVTAYSITAFVFSSLEAATYNRATAG